MTRPHETDEPTIRRFPEPTALTLDSGTRVTDGGRTLVGGSPLRIVRLSSSGAAVVARWRAGGPVGGSDGEHRLARRLVDSGLFHPMPGPAAGAALSVEIVVPVRDDVGVSDTIRSVAGPGVGRIVVVDDGSVHFDDVARAVAGAAADVDVPVRFERRTKCGGPAAARNTGWAATPSDVVVFVDAGVVPETGWLETLLAHFADDGVVAVAPRVASRPSPDASAWLAAYETARSPLDMGSEPAMVVRGGRVSYVPTTTLAVRRAALEAVGGFDEAFRFGEDVDLVWRLADTGDVRYEPAARVTHPTRATWAALARQRFAYGSSAGALDVSHPGAVAPVAVNAWSLGSWGLVALGGRRGAAASAIAGVASTGALVPRLRGRVDDPVGEAVRLGAFGHLRAGAALARACLRPWLPALAVAGLFSRRWRRLAAAVAVGVPAAEWVAERPALDPVRWTAARIVDDAAYSAGVWTGCVRRRRWRPLVPTVSRMPWLRLR